jgi:phage terminase Nu1 subunit (DNA packaging protein)
MVDRGVKSESREPRDSRDDAEARRWARETRDDLEAGALTDESDKLKRRLAAEKAKKTTSE